MKRKFWHNILGVLRLAAQITALALTVGFSFNTVKSMGLPLWVFFLSIALFGLFFCGWLCPFGAVQEWLRGIGKSMTGFSIRIPARIDRYLLLSRYALFPIIMLASLAVLETRRTFLISISGGSAGVIATVVLYLVLALSLFMDRPFCKYVCSFGAMAGLLSMVRLFTIKRDSESCLHCSRCTQACTMGVKVAETRVIRDPHCINCGKCLAACPVPKALKPGFALPSLADAKPCCQSAATTSSGLAIFDQE